MSIDKDTVVGQGVERIVNDLKSRVCLGAVWNIVDHDTQEEIKEAWADIIAETVAEVVTVTCDNAEAEIKAETKKRKGDRDGQ